MKKLTALSVLLVMVLMFSCEIPQSIRVKTDPTLEIPLGTRSNVFTELIDIKEELNSLADGMDGLSVRDDIAVGSPITLSLQQDMIDISLNDFAGDTLALDTVDQTIDPVTFDVPSISISQSDTFTMDTSTIPASLNLPSPPAITGIPEIDVPSYAIPTQTIAATGLDTVEFASGTLYFDISVANASGGLVVQVTNATISDGTTTLTAGNLPLTANGSLEFDMTGVSLGNSLDIDLTLSISGGDLSSFDLTMAFPADTGATAIAPFSADTTISVNQTIASPAPVAMDISNDKLMNATVGTGSIDIDMTADAVWSIVPTINLTIDQDAASIFSDTAVIGAPVEFDLSGMVIGSNSSMSLDYDVDLVVEILLYDAFNLPVGADSFDIDTEASLDSFSTLTMDASDGSLYFEQEQATNLTSDITDLVNTITFGPDAGITIELTNDMPTGIDVELTSAALGLSGSYTFPNTGVAASNPWSLSNYDLIIGNVTDSAIDADTDPDVDFSIVVTLNGYDENGTIGDTSDDFLTLTNVTAGESYSLEGSVAADLTIASVIIESASMADQFPAAGDDPLDFSMLDDFLPAELGFQNISAALNLNLGSSGMTLGIRLWAVYTDSDSVVQNLLIVGDDSDLDGNIDDFDSDGEPDAPDDNSSDITEIPLGDAITTLINERASGITLFYDVTASGATINISDPADNQSISAVVAADIPFVITASADAELLIDDEPLIPVTEGDLFGRDGSDDDAISEYLAWITSATVNLTFSNSLPATGTNLLGLKFVMSEPSAGFEINKDIIIKSGETTTLDLGLTTDQITSMVNDTTFEPEFHIYFLAGEHSIVEGFDFNIGASMTVESAVDYVIEL
ncbi:MAG: hypothetical protein JXR86_08295 [Spirochaetales bacterium]|nr:hypothetical protein [Spirochaetales bacterium]